MWTLGLQKGKQEVTKGLLSHDKTAVESIAGLYILQTITSILETSYNYFKHFHFKNTKIDSFIFYFFPFVSDFKLLLSSFIVSEVESHQYK